MRIRIRAYAFNYSSGFEVEGFDLVRGLRFGMWGLIQISGSSFCTESAAQPVSYTFKTSAKFKDGSKDHPNLKCNLWRAAKKPLPLDLGCGEWRVGWGVWSLVVGCEGFRENERVRVNKREGNCVFREKAGVCVNDREGECVFREKVRICGNEREGVCVFREKERVRVDEGEGEFEFVGEEVTVLSRT